MSSKGWLLYDGDCGLCHGLVKRWEYFIERAGFVATPLQAEGFRERLGLSEEQLVSDIRLLFHDNRVLVGAEVYLYLLRCVWWTKPIASVFSLPGLKYIFAAGYRLVNRNRHCFRVHG